VSVGRAPVQVVVPPRLVAALLLALAAGGAIGTNGAAQADACGDPIEGFIACPDLVLSDFAGSLSSDQRSVVLVGTVANTGRETSPDAVVRGFIARVTRGKLRSGLPRSTNMSTATVTRLPEVGPVVARVPSGYLLSGQANAA